MMAGFDSYTYVRALSNQLELQIPWYLCLVLNKMPRYEHNEGKFIRVAYGVADHSGVFLSVYDKR